MPPVQQIDRNQSRAERKLARVLRHLPRYCSVVDEVVLSNTGVYVVVPRAVSGDVTISGADVQSKGRSLDDSVRHARQLAEWVGEVLGLDVRPIVVPIGGRLQLNPLFPSPIVRGVYFCSENQLLKVLTDGPDELAHDEIPVVASRVRGLAS